MVIGQLLRLKQHGSVEEYMEQCEALTVEVPHVTTNVIEEMFLNGMKKSLKEQVVRYRPMGMDEIIDTAKLIEEQENEKLGEQSKPFHRTSSAPTLIHN